jgi:hypothetical protein
MYRQIRVRGFVRAVTVVPMVTIGLGILAQAAWAGDADEIDFSVYYGFKPLEIFKLEDRSHSMLAGDFNSDGRTDLALIDNSHSRIDLLLQRASRLEDRKTTAATKVNEISSHWRFEHAKLPVDRHLSALAVGEFNGDGRTDLAYFGDPDRLVVHYQPESGDWDKKLQIRLADVERQPWGIAAGDLNSDGRDDLAVLGQRVTYLILQTAPGQFAAPIEIRNTAERLSLAMIGDLDGDARNDLFYLASDGEETKAAARLQNENRQLGPETRFDLQIDRGVILSDILEGGGREVISIDGTTGRVRVAQFARVGDSDRKLPARLVQFGFGPAGGGKSRDLAIGDLNGDGRSDVVVTDPDAAQLIVFLQHKGFGLDLGTAYPSFLGVEQVRLKDINGDGRAEVFVLSNKEKSIGVCELRKGRLSFPTTLPVVGEPVAFEISDLDGEGSAEVLYLEKASRREYKLRTLTRQHDEVWVSGRLGSDDGDLELSNEPAYMQAIDANQDGRSDLLLTSAVGHPPTLLLTDAEGVPRMVETAGGLQLGDVERGAVFSGQLDAPVTLVAQGNFARNVLLDGESAGRCSINTIPPSRGRRSRGSRRSIWMENPAMNSCSSTRGSASSASCGNRERCISPGSKSTWEPFPILGPPRAT